MSIDFQLMEHMRPTCELRLMFRVENQTYPPPELQQRWVNDDASLSEWRAIPHVSESGRPLGVVLATLRDPLS